MTNLDTVVDEVMLEIAHFPTTMKFNDTLEAAIRTALLNVAKQSFGEAYKQGVADSDSPELLYAWLNSETRAALEGK